MTESFVRVGCNVGISTAETIEDLMKQRGIPLAEVIRRAVAVLKFVEDEIAAGNGFAVIESDGSVRKADLLLP